LGSICAVMFPNLPALSTQVVRHLYAGDLIITPDDSSVQKLRDTFFEGISSEKFYKMPFHDQMNLVDEFIYEQIEWKSDYSQYKMIGLLLTPSEVIQKKGS